MRQERQNKPLVYFRYRDKGRYVYLHRHVLGLTPAQNSSLVVDHMNRDTLDNRRKNLRAVTKRQNSLNRIGHNKTGYKGVTKLGLGFIAEIRLGGKRYRVSGMSTAKEAHEEYKKLSRYLHGEYGRTDNSI